MTAKRSTKVPKAFEERVWPLEIDLQEQASNRLKLLS